MPSPSDEAIGAYQTHAAYLGSAAMTAERRLFGSPGTSLLRLHRRVQALPQLLRTQRTSTVDVARISKSLRNAWGSELLLALGRHYVHEDEVVRLSNNWNVVMLYYITFHGTHALLAAQNQAAPPDHAKLQRQFGAFWVDRSINLAPFSFAEGTTGWQNVPPGESIDSNVHAWVSCDSSNCLSIFAKGIHSTRRAKLEDAYSRARDDKKKERNRQWRDDDAARSVAGKRVLVRNWTQGTNLKPHEKISVEQSVRKTSYIDYLYRLRIRSNYEDSTMFTDGPTDELSSGVVRRDTAYLASAYMLAVESFILRMVGSTWLEQEARDWANGNIPPGLNEGIGRRLDLHFP